MTTAESVNSINTEADKPSQAVLEATREKCKEKLERAYSPTTTTTAREIVRMGAGHDGSRVGRALQWLESESSIDELGFSMTIEPTGESTRQRYRLAEAGDQHD